MMKFFFTAETDFETGELGWKDSRIAINSPYGPLAYGYGLAHDVIEHFALETVADEIMAHAALYWVRYQSGYVYPYGGRGLTLEDIGAEWANLSRAMYDFHLSSPPRTCKLDDTTEEDISTIIEAGRKTVREEVGEENWQDIADEIEKAFRGWFRIGYRKAAKRWSRWNMSPSEVSMLYHKVAKVFEEHMAQFEGEKIVLTVSKDGHVSIKELESESL